MATKWTLAPCLVKLRSQINAAYPARSKASDGTIGDAAHAKTKSEHNPDAGGVVRAFDITHDPAHGLHGTSLALKLVSSRDPRILYVIWNRSIARSYAKPGIPAWTWAKYTGPDPHTNHVHLSVVADARANSTTPWRIATQQEDTTMAMTKDVADAFAGLKAQARDIADRVNKDRAATDAALKALAAGIGPAVQEAVEQALATDYDAEVTLTKKEVTE